MSYRFTRDVMIEGVVRRAGRSADDLDAGRLASCLHVGHVEMVPTEVEPGAEDARPARSKKDKRGAKKGPPEPIEPREGAEPEPTPPAD